METILLHFVYKTTNKINGKIYIGIHSTMNPNDSYYGSGKLILKALKKYGKTNFNRKILSFFETRDDALHYEEKIVNENFISRTDTYNFAVGGKGGNTKTKELHPFHGKHHSEESKKKMSNAKKGKYKKEKNPFYGKQHTEESKKKMSDNRKGKMTGEDHFLYGKHPSDETRKKMSEAKLNFIPWNKGKRNSLKWINKNGETKMVPPEQIEQYLSKGWSIGRGKVK